MTEIKGLTGVIPALVTPLTKDGIVDEPGVARLVEHTIRGGVSGLLALGTTGETASLDEPTRRAMLTATIKAAGGRVPVISGVIQSHVRGAIDEVHAATRLGAAAVLVAPPFYYLVDQPAVLAFYRAVARESSVPVFVYHIPQNTKVMTEPETVAALAHEGVVAGIKDSSRDFEYFERVCLLARDMPAFRIFTGSDTMLLPSLVVGGAGTICAGANVSPAWIVRIHDLYREGDLAAARAQQDELIGLILKLRSGVFPAAVKAALEAMKICERWMAAPVAPLGPQESRALADWLAGAGLLAEVSKAARAG
jgi:4-hydroxy-tetrahydrodipicolinate synthase